jgi:glycosyltransferase involved in cell wall biosynthesis
VAPSEAAAGSTAVDDAVRAVTWIVVPAYQEESAVGEVVAELRRRFPHVVVVDDGSADATARAAAAAGARVVRHAVNRGQGAALQTGIDFALAAGARYVVTFDSDGQHRVDDADRLLAPLVAGEAEFCLGSRFLEKPVGVPPGRRLLLRCAFAFTRLTSRARVTDTHNGLRAMTRRAARHLSISLDRMAHASELLDQVHASGLPYTERPVTVRYTAYSQGKGQRAGAALRIVLDYLIGKLR